MLSAGQDLLRFADGRRFATILADPPWQFTNKTGKVAPEHKRLARYGTMKLDEIMAVPVADVAAIDGVAGAQELHFALIDRNGAQQDRLDASAAQAQIHFCFDVSCQ